MSFIGCAGSEDPGPNYDSTSHNHGKPVKIVDSRVPIVQPTVMRESLRAAAPGAAGREVPIPGVPKKSDQPSEDIRQNKPIVRLQQNEAGVKGMKWGQRKSENKLNPEKARQILSGLKIEHGADFHTLGHDQVDGLLDHAKSMGFRKSPTAPGSTARSFHDRLQRFAARQGSEESREGGPGSGRKPGGGGGVKSPLGKAPELGGQGPAQKPQAGVAGGNVSTGEPRRQAMAHLRNQGWTATGSSGGMLWHGKEGKPGAILVDNNGGWDHVQKQGDGPFKRIAAGPDLDSLKSHMQAHGLNEAREGGPGSGRKPGGGSGGGKSKLHSIHNVISGSHVMGDQLADYHAARHVRDATRGGAKAEHLAKVKQALKNHRVTVSLDNDKIRIHNPSTGAEIKLGSEGPSSGSAHDVASQHQQKIQQQNEKMPGPIRDVMNPRDPRSTEAQKPVWGSRRSLRRKPITEMDDSERDRSASGLTA